MAGKGNGKVLRVDLTTGRCYQEVLPSDTLQNWLGGRGLGSYLIRSFSCYDSFDPEIPLIFTAGPLCDTPVPLSTRAVLTARSPLTGTIFSSSSGGNFSLQLKRSGFSALLLHGRSPFPCLLAITPDGASIKPASDLWGLGAAATFQRLDGDVGIAAIGPAGENGVRYATIETKDGEPFSRGGLGAVMGDKRLKAVTVCGDCVTPIADQPAFDKALEDLMRLFRASPFLFGPFGIREHGTVALVDLLAQRGMLPGQNFKTFRGISTWWNAAALRSLYASQSAGCHDCPVACKRQLSDGSLLPDYDDLSGFGGLCGLTELSEITTLCHQCHELGLDPLSAVATIAAWREITGQEQPTLSFAQLLKETSHRTTGRGQLLSLGAAQLAQKLEHPEGAMTVKGLELPPYDPRASTGLALGYATSPHGGNHLTAWPIASEILRKPVPTDRFSFDGKARIIAMFEDANAAVDSLVVCRFACAAAELEEMAALLAAVSGEGYSPTDLVQIGRRTVIAERSFNRNNGFVAADDCLPDRFFTESANDLPPLDRSRFQQELDSYHRIREQQLL